MNDQSDKMKVNTLIAQAITKGLERKEAIMLMLWVFDRSLYDRAWLITHDQEALNEAQQKRWSQAVSRRLDKEPLAYITGQQAFYDLCLSVDKGVLIPRGDTEVIVEWALALIGDQPCSVCDWGTGSGAIALAIQSQCPQVSMTALDKSPVACNQAQYNASHLGLSQVQVVLGDWQEQEGLSQLKGPYDLIVSNPPYIEENDPHLRDLQHEPLSALTSGSDGFYDLERIIQVAPAWLTPQGHLLLEHGWNQGPHVFHLFEQKGWRKIEKRQDTAGHWRCTGAICP